MRTSRPPASSLVASLLLLPACGETPEAQPLGTTVPVALVLAVVGIGGMAAMTRWVLRRADRSLPRSRLTAALVLAPPALVGVPAILFLCGVVAFAFRKPGAGWFSWEDTVGIAAAVVGGVLLVHLVACAVAAAVTDPRPPTRAAGRVALCIVAGCFVLTTGLGLLWLPAIVLSFRTRQPPLPGATVRSAARAPTARC